MPASTEPPRYGQVWRYLSSNLDGKTLWMFVAPHGTTKRWLLYLSSGEPGSDVSGYWSNRIKARHAILDEMFMDGGLKDWTTYWERVE